MISGSTLNIDIGAGGTSLGGGGGTVYDQLLSAGNMTLNGATLAVSALSSSLAIGNKYFIVENTTANADAYGAFSNGSTVTDSSGDVFAISYAAAGNDATANDISLTVLTVVPEPGTWASSALVLAGLLCSQRRRLSGWVRRA